MDSLSGHRTFPRGTQKDTWKHVAMLSFQSLGVVYGHISIAPLYVFDTIQAKDFVSEQTAYELFSVVFWTLTIISVLKYAFIVLRVDDDGEGGPFALYSLLCRHAKVSLLPSERYADELMRLPETPAEKSKSESRARRAIEKHRSSHCLMLFVALFGACMIINDGVFTPAISVLSASQGVERSLTEISASFHPKNSTKISSALGKYVSVPSACAIQILLFMLQQHGTHKIGFLFAPIITIWLLFISGVGLYNIIHCNPKILYAVSPVYMYRFVRNVHKNSWKSLSSILLCIGGSEAMFADLGHFSKKSIKITFISFVYPALLLCYAGQFAFLSKKWSEGGYDFDHLSKSMPDHTRHVFVLLSLFASAVGSQASITASFSIIKQCLALNCFPRVKVIHTSDQIHGQVYIPDVNWILMALSLSVTIGFHSIERIGYSAGLAIVSGMLVTTCLMSLVIALYWERSLFLSMCFLMSFGFVEVMYLSSCLLNFHKGAWYLVVLSAVILTVMLAWHYGTMKKYEFDLQNKVSIEWLTDFSPGLGISRVPGVGFIYSDIDSGIPAFFSHFITNLPAFHQVLIFVSFKSLPLPHLPADQRYLIGRVGHKDYKIYRCIVRYGYCDPIRDTDDFEEQILRSIAEFISLEDTNSESLMSFQERMVVIGNRNEDGKALVSISSSDSFIHPVTSDSNQPATGSFHDIVPAKTKKVRFVLPPVSPAMTMSVRTELQELVDARESGMTYFLGQSHLTVRNGSNFLKRILIAVYAFLDKNSREQTVALNIPHAALVEVGMVYTI